jgi:uncharacterized membrane protein SpoIIM required for sporulation
MLETIFTLPILIITIAGVIGYILTGYQKDMTDTAYIQAREQFEREQNALDRQERFRQGLNATNDRKNEE